ncbi:DUF6247 family protein [Streptomyces sp. NBC_00424]|uniref:DUF6247 family protein n=1 Tax=Streptomyces sp. NBC_00424 TaxID=2903648 RepID=UPI002251AD73|nr:DUF6247 family protein [Streptomyces sp. NBC_00424]MCX5077837.1 DUF6247 family protein [Streptomyces sp. NBC_00424]
MSAQPEHTPIPSYRPHPTPRPNSCPQLRTDRRAAQWAPAFEGEWAAAPAESRRTFSLGGLYEVFQDWQGRLAHALGRRSRRAPVAAVRRGRPFLTVTPEPREQCPGRAVSQASGATTPWRPEAAGCRPGNHGRPALSSGRARLSDPCRSEADGTTRLAEELAVPSKSRDNN